MATKQRTVREIPFSRIDLAFSLASYWFGTKWCPAVWRNDDGTYRIRVVKSQHHGRTTYDYFELAADGTVRVVPRGYARDYKPGRVTGLDEAVATYAEPSGSEPRWVL